MSSQTSSNDITHWLKKAVFKEHLTDFTVNILGNTEKGDGYMGDIVFVHVDGKTIADEPKSFDLVLKCSKKSQVLRDSFPIKVVYENEIYIYNHVFPAFKQFQIEKGIENCFDSVSPYFGNFVTDNMEVLVLQNLKVLGYKLYERTKPLDSNHLKLLLREYGKLHAISGAMQDQRPEEFKQLVDGLEEVWKTFVEMTDVFKLFSTPIDETYQLIKEDVGEHVARKLLEFKNEIGYINTQLVNDRTHFSVINHGDNWNNNFMFKYEEQSHPIQAAMLDWQGSKFANPVLDLSYFLYACVSREDLKNFEHLLKEYHTSFSNFLTELGSDPEKIFPYSKLVEDWKVFAKFGLMLALLVVKVAVAEKDEVLDMAETVESGSDVTSTFLFEIKDKSILKERMLAVVEHAVDFGVL